MKRSYQLRNQNIVEFELSDHKKEDDNFIFLADK